jgi:hypothetical protein
MDTEVHRDTVLRMDPPVHHIQSSVSVREPIWPSSTEPIDERSTGVPNAKRMRQAHARKAVGAVGRKRATVRTAAVKDPAKRTLDC